MREIKFRAWSAKYHTMFQVGDKFGTTDPLDPVVYYLEGQPGILLQYTGLKDSNGQEVYEGDIANYWGKVVTIIYDEESAGFAMRGLEKWDCHFLRPNPKDYEVIGNIYSNPDLLT